MLEETNNKKMNFVYLEENNNSYHLNFKIPSQLKKGLDHLVSLGLFFTRSEAVRYMIKDYFDRHNVCPNCGSIISNTE